TRGHRLHPALLGVALEDRIAAAPAGVALVAHRLAHLGRAVRLEPEAGFLAKLVQIVHGATSPLRKRQLPCPAAGVKLAPKLQRLVRDRRQAQGDGVLERSLGEAAWRARATVRRA